MRKGRQNIGGPSQFSGRPCFDDLSLPRIKNFSEQSGLRSAVHGLGFAVASDKMLSKQASEYFNVLLVELNNRFEVV
jgi:hypothetical protein